MMRRRRFIARSAGAFTILELLVAIAVLMIVMLVLLQITGKVGEIWRSSSGKISAFQNARAAFSTLNLQISRATLNAYNDYVNSAGEGRTDANTESFVPTNCIFFPDQRRRSCRERMRPRTPGMRSFFRLRWERRMTPNSPD
jgi:type II secretory pathway pseudopilin PulG